MGKVVRKLAPSLLPGEKDTRPYWQRQGRSVEGWAKHRRQVQDWKKRNPEATRAHSMTFRSKRKAKYGFREIKTDLQWIKVAEEFNETLDRNRA